MCVCERERAKEGVCNSLSGCVRYESSRGELSGLEAPKILWLTFEDESQRKNISWAACVCTIGCRGLRCFLTPIKLLLRSNVFSFGGKRTDKAQHTASPLLTGCFFGLINMEKVASSPLFR